jgi:hypothetical protein
LPISKTISRAEFERLKADHDALMADVNDLRDRLTAQANELKVQFQRIAEMQAVLDEERLANTVWTERPPLRSR